MFGHLAKSHNAVSCCTAPPVCQGSECLDTLPKVITRFLLVLHPLCVRYEFQTERGYKWGGVGYLAFFWIFSNLLSIIALTLRDRSAHGKGHAHPDREQGIAPTLRPSLQKHLLSKQHRDDHSSPLVSARQPCPAIS